MVDHIYVGECNVLGLDDEAAEKETHVMTTENTTLSLSGPSLLDAFCDCDEVGEG